MRSKWIRLTLAAAVLASGVYSADLLPATLFAADAAKSVTLNPDQQKAVETLRGKGAAVMQIAADTDALEVNLGIIGKQATDGDLALVKQLPNVTQLNLHDTAVTDAGLAELAGMTSLTRLHLNGTAVTDAGIKHLKNLTALTYLNLYDTAVTDEGIKELAGLKNLQQLYLWQTKVTDAGAKAMKEAVPAVMINRGEELKVVAPPPPAAEAPAKADAKKADAKKGDAKKADAKKAGKKGKKAAAAKPAPAIDEDGYIRTWLVLGPIAIEGTAVDALDEEQIEGEANLQAKEGEKAKAGDKELPWKKVQAEEFSLDFNTLLDAAGQSNVCVYAVASVESPEEVKDVVLLTGTNDQGKVWFNGKEVSKAAESRPLEADSEKAEGLTLKKGTNVVVMKVINESNDWEACARFVDKDGKPIKGLTVK